MTDSNQNQRKTTTFKLGFPIGNSELQITEVEQKNKILNGVI